VKSSLIEKVRIFSPYWGWGRVLGTSIKSLLPGSLLPPIAFPTEGGLPYPGNPGQFKVLFFFVRYIGVSSPSSCRVPIKVDSFSLFPSIFRAFLLYSCSRSQMDLGSSRTRASSMFSSCFVSLDAEGEWLFPLERFFLPIPFFVPEIGVSQPPTDRAYERRPGPT